MLFDTETKTTLELLNLPNLRVLDLCEGAEDIRITAESVILPPACPNCGVVGEYVGAGRKKQEYRDLPIRAKRIGLLVNRRRLQCKACKKTFSDWLPDMDEKRSVTRRLLTYIQEQSLRRTFVSISHEVGLDEKTVRNIFSDHVDLLDKSRKYETPEVLGIDEVHLLHEFRCVITDVKKAGIMEMLEKRTKVVVTNYLFKLPDRERVKVVTIDMHDPYRDAVHAALPGAVVIADKFHVQRMANQALEAYRKAFRKSLDAKSRKALMHDRFLLLTRRSQLSDENRLKLETWTLNFPLLATAYELKEQFFDIWEAETAELAWARFEAWAHTIPVELQPTFAAMNDTVVKWKKEIFAYFDHRVTNAVTEALNRNIKDRNREGRGYTFDVLRAKMLYGTRQTRPRFGQEWRVLEVAPRYEPTAIAEFVQNSLDAVLMDESGQVLINTDQDED